jgi:hypothetical protein
LGGFDQIFGVAFVINGQLFAGVNAVVLVGNNFQPNLGSLSVFAAALGQLCKFPARLGTKFRRQSNCQSLRANGMRAILFAAPLQES